MPVTPPAKPGLYFDGTIYSVLYESSLIPTTGVLQNIFFSRRVGPFQWKVGGGGGILTMQATTSDCERPIRLFWTVGESRRWQFEHKEEQDKFVANWVSKA